MAKPARAQPRTGRKKRAASHHPCQQWYQTEERPGSLGPDDGERKDGEAQCDASDLDEWRTHWWASPLRRASQLGLTPHPMVTSASSVPWSSMSALACGSISLGMSREARSP